VNAQEMGSRSSTHATLEVQKEEEKNRRKRNRRLKNERVSSNKTRKVIKIKQKYCVS
jgi:hypothetical protein